MLQVWQMLVISVGIVFAFGQLIGDKRQGHAILAAMLILLVTGVAVAYWAEAAGTPILHGAGLDPAGGNMEGKEVRFGLALSALWAAVTTGLSCGAVNAMHGSFTPIGGLVPLVLIKLGEILPGGVGSGLYGMLVMAIIAVFVAGLMVGRTPEYLGKKIEAKEVKMAVLASLVLPVFVLGFSAVAAVLPGRWRRSGTAARMACPRSSMPMPPAPATTARPLPRSAPTPPGGTARLAFPCSPAASPTSSR